MSATGNTPIRVGIAGWSYDDWNGTVYPPRTRDKLCYIAPFVDVIEINSSFYRTPTPRTVESWVRRTENLPALRFTAKLPQEITHRQHLSTDGIAAFRDAFLPMQEAGKLSHLLAQFRYDFGDTPAHRDHLKAVCDHFGDMPNLTLELRHGAWQQEEALDYISGLGVTLANLDYPVAQNGFDMQSRTIGEHAYMRLHGRNAKAWFDSKAGRDDTYNYRYSPDQIDGIAGRAVQIASLSKSLTLVANNHYKGKEVANALQIKALLTGDEVDVPPMLAKTYPDLNAIRKRKQDVGELLGFDWSKTEDM
jgi:uncharacterized protein YecE (DUF72 family)